MKTWTNARLAHQGRFRDAQRFAEVLTQLEAAGAPPPDDVGLCHADWRTTKYSICRINMSLSHEVSVTGFKREDGPHFRDAFTGPQRATELADVTDLVQRFAAFVKAEYAPEMWQYPTVAAGQEDMDDVYLRVPKHLLTGPWRASPYFVPAEGIRPSWEKLIEERERLIAALKEATGNNLK
jgi:hypothetical protein